MAQKKSFWFSNIIFYLIVIFFALAGFWAYVAEIDQVVRAEGEVEPVGKVQPVQSLYGGTVAELNVAVGDMVEKDQVVIRLDEQEPVAEFEQNEITYVSAAARYARLYAEANSLSYIEFPDDVPLSLRLSERAVFLSRQKTLEGRRRVLQQELQSARNDKLEADNAIKAARNRLKLVDEEYDLYEPLVKQGIEPRVKLFDIETRKVQTQDEITQRRIESNGAEIRIQKFLDEITQLDNQFRSDAGEQMYREVEARDKAASERIRLAERLSQTDLKAPSSGIVTSVAVPGPGAVVRGGDVLLEIVPSADNFTILARIPVKDISKVSEGQTARVSFSAYDFSRYGVMMGRFKRIAQNTTETEQGERYYEAWVETEGKTFSKSPIEPQIVPGMAATVDALGEKRTVVEYIMSPLNRMASRALTE